MAQRNRYRIIGGQWRGRLLNFPDRPGLRPTNDRVRETVFNWLAMDIAGARVLELYAGTAALSMEALSRGACTAVAIEQDRALVGQMRANGELLKADFHPLKADVPSWLAKPNRLPEGFAQFDLIFIDPPFRQDSLKRLLPVLAASGLVADNAKVYVECERELGVPAWPTGWRQCKQAHAGQVQYFLLET